MPGNWRSRAAVRGASAQLPSMNLPDLNMKLFQAILWMPPAVAALSASMPGMAIAPFNWAKLLWRMKVRRPKTARMPMMGVRKSLQSSPIGAALALSVIQSVRDFNFSHGVEDSELSWILERNDRVRHVIEMVGGVPYKKYRVYEKPL